MRWSRLLSLGLLALVALTVAAACNNSDDSERLAAQRLFRNVLLQADATSVADVRVEGLIDDLPPDFPLPDGLTLLGSAFTDTDSQRRLIVGWESSTHADDLFEFYRQALSQEPWIGDDDPPRYAGVDFISFTDIDNPGFLGELRIAQEGDQAVVVFIAVETTGAEPLSSR